MASLGSQSLPKAVGGGAFAFVAGYLATYRLTIAWVEEWGLTQSVQSFTDASHVAPSIVAWIFYSAHNVTTTILIDIPFVGGETTMNMIGEMDGLGPELYAIPPLLLLAVGFVVASEAGIREASDSLWVGGGITVGYLPLAAAATYLVTITTDVGTGGPDPVLAVGVAGLVYPLVFGTLGAVLGSVVRGR